MCGIKCWTISEGVISRHGSKILLRLEDLEISISAFIRQTTKRVQTNPLVFHDSVELSHQFHSYGQYSIRFFYTNLAQSLESLKKVFINVDPSVKKT